MRQPRPINVNMDAFAETERELRRRVALQLGRPTRKSSEQSGGPTDEHSQAGSSTNNQPDEAAQVPRVLPSEPTQDARAVSELNNLLLDTSWPEETESSSVRIFSGTVMESLAMPDQGTAMSSNAQSESMPVSNANTNDYQPLRGIDHDRQGMYQNGMLMDFSSTGTPTFDGMDPSQVPISPTFLGPSVANQDLHFQQKQQHQHQQQQQWASWPGWSIQRLSYAHATVRDAIAVQICFRTSSTLALLLSSPPMKSFRASARRVVEMGSASIAFVSSAPPLAR